MLYNQANYWLYKAMQEFHTEEMTEEAIIKHRHAARTQEAEAQERPLGSLINRLSGRKAALSAGQTACPEPCAPPPGIIRTKNASRRAL